MDLPTLHSAHVLAEPSDGTDLEDWGRLLHHRTLKDMGYCAVGDITVEVVPSQLGFPAGVVAHSETAVDWHQPKMARLPDGRPITDPWGRYVLDTYDGVYRTIQR